ncbi:MAG: trypsin-like peptidase domain-containing protein, partial [Candidatus Dormibacteraeota bacterium]|nr:trypsin-like peptidase domain-containing protein [Candidatus Dormibacteraeota bacterium]
MDPFSRGDGEDQASSAPSNPPQGDPATPPEASSREWQTPPSDGAATEPAQDPGAPYPQQYPAQGYAGSGGPGYGRHGYGYPGYGYPGYWNPQTQPPTPPRRRTALLAIAIVAGLMVLAVGFGGGIGAALLVGHGIGLPQASTPSGGGDGDGHGNPNHGSSNGNGNGGTGSTGSVDLSKLAGQLDPAIVDINGVQTNGQGQTVTEDAGTGVILTSNGEVLTNNHVIEGNSSMTATLASGQTVPVKVLGEDPSADVALVQLEGVHNLPTINIKNGARAGVGDAVAAFGNALGQGGTPASSQGSVTATDQTITASLGSGSQDSETLNGMIEESAQICEGDSGGVLANAQGQYLGMLTAASSGGNGDGGSSQSSSSCSNDGFVIPASKIIPIVKQIESGQRTASVIIGVPGFLGVEVDDSQASAAGTGAQVVGLVQDGGAAQAGLPQTFVITAIDGQSVTDSSSLSTVLQQYTPGTTVQVTWNDGQGGAS